jgi:predicted dehydrogenase
VAVVSGDRAKRRGIARRYGLEPAFTYEQFDDCLAQVDAVYIALPNSMHAEYAIKAAGAGVHVLCEKPLAVTALECRQVIAACRAAGVRLMVAHFSDCIVHDRVPEPSGEEGLQDVRIVETLYESAPRGRPVALSPFHKRARPTARQRMTRPGVRKPELVNVQAAHRD